MKNKTLDRLLSDSHFRLFTLSALGGGWNLFYAVYQLVLAGYYRSYWFLTMGVYYLSICLMRASALHLENYAGHSARERSALKRNGLLTLLLAFIFTGVVCLAIVEKRNGEYNTIVAITIAAYTFYCVVLAIINLIKLKKDRTVQKILLRNCSMVYAAGSLFSLERILLGTFTAGDTGFILTMEAASGAGFTLLIVLFGINLLLMSSGRKAAGKNKKDKHT